MQRLNIKPDQIKWEEIVLWLHYCHGGVSVYCRGNIIHFIALGFLRHIFFPKYFSALKKSSDKRASMILNVNPYHHEYLLNASED